MAADIHRVLFPSATFFRSHRARQLSLNSGPAASHGMSWHPRSSKREKKDVTCRNDGDGRRNVVQST